MMNKKKLYESIGAYKQRRADRLDSRENMDYGVKGMKWGKKKEKQATGSSPKGRSALPMGKSCMEYLKKNEKTRRGGNFMQDLGYVIDEATDVLGLGKGFSNWGEYWSEQCDSFDASYDTVMRNIEKCKNLDEARKMAQTYVNFSKTDAHTRKEKLEKYGSYSGYQAGAEAVLQEIENQERHANHVKEMKARDPSYSGDSEDEMYNRLIDDDYD